MWCFIPFEIRISLTASGLFVYLPFFCGCLLYFRPARSRAGEMEAEAWKSRWNSINWRVMVRVNGFTVEMVKIPKHLWSLAHRHCSASAGVHCTPSTYSGLCPDGCPLSTGNACPRGAWQPCPPGLRPALAGPPGVFLPRNAATLQPQFSCSQWLLASHPTIMWVIIPLWQQFGNSNNGLFPNKHILGFKYLKWLGWSLTFITAA